MVLYNFKTIAVVPGAGEFIDIVLSKTQRKTPTVVHKGYKISRIRRFYMRKVKYTQETCRERLSQILDQFPRLDDIHPFYADLINVLYSKDHYKLALGQLSTVRSTIDSIGKDYIKLLKFGDSLYRCKELKRAALGRMCTAIKKLGASLAYIEQVRQHLSRLPSIDPSTRTLLITGYPNVGKSSFINKISRADVDVQPYAFTTKSLFVGHFDYKYIRWQAIDTPGILDHPLEERNVIEMQAVTALAHLHATILYFVDISEQCGYTLKMQVDLFHNIKPLFANKPLLIIANKTDARSLESLDADEKMLLDGMAKERNTQIMAMSNISEEGIQNVVSAACDLLLEQRVERKLSAKKVNNVLNRLTVAQPEKRDDRVREIFIPASVRAKMGNSATNGDIMEVEGQRKTLKEIQQENGGPGVFAFDIREHWKIRSDDWKWDIIPEIMDGKNITDFVDADIDAKLAELEREEDELERQFNEQTVMDNDSDLDEEERAALELMRTNKKLIKQSAQLNKSISNKPRMPRSGRPQRADQAEATLQQLGLNTTKFKERAHSLTRSTLSTTKRRRDSMEIDDNDRMDVEESGEGSSKRQRLRGRSSARDSSRSRSMSAVRDRSLTGFRNDKQKSESDKQHRKALQSRITREKTQRQGESDRRIFTAKPKHLFSGKRSNGTANHR